MMHERPSSLALSMTAAAKVKEMPKIHFQDLLFLLTSPWGVASYPLQTLKLLKSFSTCENFEFVKRFKLQTTEMEFESWNFGAI